MQKEKIIYVVTCKSDATMGAVRPQRSFGELGDANSYAQHLFQNEAHLPFLYADWPDDADVTYGTDGEIRCEFMDEDCKVTVATYVTPVPLVYDGELEEND